MVESTNKKINYLCLSQGLKKLAVTTDTDFWVY